MATAGKRKTLEDLLAALRERGCQPRKNGSHWQARCPSHEDAKPSLSISPGKKRPFVLKCHAGCEYNAIVAALGLRNSPPLPRRTGSGPDRKPLGEIVAVYDYDTYQVVRFSPKNFRQRQPDGKGGWIWNLKKIEPRLYHQMSSVRA